MGSDARSKLMLGLTGFIQVYFVAVNTVFLSRAMYGGVVIAAFLVSFTWSFNVKRVAFGSTADRVIYSLGAMTGSVIGLAMSDFLIRLLTKN